MPASERQIRVLENWNKPEHIQRKRDGLPAQEAWLTKWKDNPEGLAESIARGEIRPTPENPNPDPVPVEMGMAKMIANKMIADGIEHLAYTKCEIAAYEAGIRSRWDNNAKIEYYMESTGEVIPCTDPRVAGFNKPKSSA